MKAFANTALLYRKTLWLLLFLEVLEIFMKMDHASMLAVLFVLVSPPFSAHAEESPTDLDRRVTAAIAEGQAVQAEAEKWESERRELLAQIQEARRQLRWTIHQTGKYAAYIENQQEVLDELRRRKAEVETMEMDLSPFLDEVLDRLTTFIDKDLPFLPEERKKRLAALEETLDDYHSPLSQKTQRVLEALRIETEYGTSVETGSTVIELSDGPARVDLFRLGRTALYYRTPDGGRCGWFNRDTASWEPLPDRFSREIQRAMAVAEKQRTPELLDLPVGRPGS